MNEKCYLQLVHKSFCFHQAAGQMTQSRGAGGGVGGRATRFDTHISDETIELEPLELRGKTIFKLSEVHLTDFLNISLPLFANNFSFAIKKKVLYLTTYPEGFPSDISTAEQWASSATSRCNAGRGKRQLCFLKTGIMTV